MKQVFVSGSNGTVSSASVVYNRLNGSQQTWSTAEFYVQGIIAAAGTLRNLRVKISLSPGAGKSRTFVVRLNGADTSLTLTISDSATVASNTTDSVAVVAGDLVSLKQTPSGTPTTSTEASWSCEFESTSPRISVYPTGTSVDILTSTTRCFNGFFIGQGSGVANWSSSNTTTEVISPLAGTIKAFYFKLANAPGAGTSYTLSIYKNGFKEATSEFAIADSSDSGNVTGLSIAVSEGDRLNISSIAAGTPAASVNTIWGVAFEATTDGESALVMDTGVSSLNGTTTTYSVFGLLGLNLDTTEATINRVLSGVTSWTLKKLRVRLSTAPNTGRSYTFTVRKNGADVTNTVTIADTATTGSDTTHTDTFSQDDVLTFKTVPSGASPGLPTAEVSAIQYIMPKSVVGVTKSLKYTIEDPNSLTKSLKYTVRKKATAPTKSLRYTIEKKTAPTKSLKYTVRKATAAITKSDKYTIEKKITPTKSLQYVVTPILAITKSLKYTIEKKVSATKSMKYCVRVTPPRVGDYYDPVNTDADTVVMYQGWYDGIGQAITGDGRYLDSISFKMGKNGTPPGNVYVEVYAITGTFGTNASPTGPVLATSASKVANTELSSSPTIANFVFTGLNHIFLTAGTNYIATVRYIEPTSDSSNRVFVSVDTTAGNPPNGHAGNFTRHVSGGSWITSSTWDLGIIVYTDPTIVKDLKYAVRVKRTPLTKSLRYVVEIIHGITKSLKYTIRKAPAAPTKLLKYTIRKPHAAVTKSLGYIVNLNPAIQKSDKYTIERKVSTTKALKYEIEKPIAVTKSLKYTIEKKVPLTKSAKYTIEKKVSATKQLQYQLQPISALIKALKYTVEKKVVTTKSARYAIEKKIPTTKSLRYAIEDPNSITKALAYKVEKKVAVTKTLKYEVEDPNNVTKALRYGIEKKSSKTKSLRYAIRKSTPIGKSLSYNMDVDITIASKGNHILVTKSDRTVVELKSGRASQLTSKGQ